MVHHHTFHSPLETRSAGYLGTDGLVKGDPVEWPPCSPDLTPLDFFLWGHMKSLVYETSVETAKDNLLAHSLAARQEIQMRPDIFEKEYQNMLCRFDRLSPDYVAAEIVKGILEERETMTVPRFMEFWICLLRCLPQGARRRWRDIFFTRVYPEPISTSVHMGNEKLIKTDKFIHGKEHPLPTLVTSSLSETMSGIVNKGYSKDSDINGLEDTLEKKLEETNMDAFNESLANPISKSDYEANRENLKENKAHTEIIH